MYFQTVSFIIWLILSDWSVKVHSFFQVRWAAARPCLRWRAVSVWCLSTVVGWRECISAPTPCPVPTSGLTPPSSPTLESAQVKNKQEHVLCDWFWLQRHFEICYWSHISHFCLKLKGKVLHANTIKWIFNSLYNIMKSCDDSELICCYCSTSDRPLVLVILFKSHDAAASYGSGLHTQLHYRQRVGAQRAHSAAL